MEIILICLNSVVFDYKFSICTLVNNLIEYEGMVSSFKNSGFNDDCRFFYIDNIFGNAFDAYDGINNFLTHSRSEYIIISHQDVSLDFDGYDQLLAVIDGMNKHDPKWAVLGNAGYYDFNTKLIRITDPYGQDQNSKNLPEKTKSLDENFLVIKKAANLSLSRNIGGFHFYGTDLCVIARILGWNAYVVDFHVRHKGKGNIDSEFYKAKNRFIDKYSKVVKYFSIRTTCDMMVVTGFKFINKILNKKLIYSIVKRLQRI